MHNLRRILVVLTATFCILSGSAPVGATGQFNPVYLGVNLPTMGIVYGGYTWSYTQQNYFTPAIFQDIKSNLTADFIRTDWVPNWVYGEPVRWQREDVTMDGACSHGLGVLVIVPPPSYDSRGINDELQIVQAFFARYTLREPGCRIWAEIENEADRFYSVQQYAAYYEQVVPIIRQYKAYGIRIITSGTSGLDIPWTGTLSKMLSSDSAAHVDGYGFHPYGVNPVGVGGAASQEQQATAADPAPVYITEMGETTTTDLFNAINSAYRFVPFISLYTYKNGPNDPPPSYGLVNNTALYNTAKNAFAYVRAQVKGQAQHRLLNVRLR